MLLLHACRRLRARPTSLTGRLDSLSGSIRCIADTTVQAGTQLGLTEDQVEFRAVAQDFARKELLPYAAEWDARKHFPVDKLRAAAQLGFGGILVGDDVGQQFDHILDFSGALQGISADKY